MVLEKTEVRQIDITLVKQLGCNDGTYRPIGSRASGHYEVNRKDNEVRPHKVVGLTPVESPAERSNCVATRGRWRALVETNSLTTVCVEVALIEIPIDCFYVALPLPIQVEPSSYVAFLFDKAPEPITAREPTVVPGRRITRSAIIADLEFG